MSQAGAKLALMDSDNGILAKVGGEFVGRGAMLLPPAATAAPEPVRVTLEADAWVGCVVIIYERRLARHRRSSHWFWHAVRADSAPAAPAPRALENVGGSERVLLRDRAAVHHGL